MLLSRRCVEMLVDLVDNKLTSIQVFDREDAREVMILETCKRELMALSQPRKPATGTVIPFPQDAESGFPAQAAG